MFEERMMSIIVTGFRKSNINIEIFSFFCIFKKIFRKFVTNQTF